MARFLPSHRWLTGPQRGIYMCAKEDFSGTHNFAGQTRRRRTFAIISHPDAGKTTLTEKLLLYSGLIGTAGMVKNRKGKQATSDWMGMEQERGSMVVSAGCT